MKNVMELTQDRVQIKEEKPKSFLGLASLIFFGACAQYYADVSANKKSKEKSKEEIEYLERRIDSNKSCIINDGFLIMFALIGALVVDITLLIKLEATPNLSTSLSIIVITALIILNLIIFIPVIIMSIISIIDSYKCIKKCNNEIIELNKIV